MKAKLTFEPDQVAVAEVQLSMRELLRIVTRAQQEHYRGTEFEAADFREMALLGGKDDLVGTGLATPPVHTLQRTRYAPIEHNAPEWVGTTLTATGRYEPADGDAPDDAAAREAARLDGVLRLSKQIEALVIQKNVTVAEFLSYYQDLKDDVALYLSGALLVAAPTSQPAGGVEVKVRLPLRPAVGDPAPRHEVGRGRSARCAVRRCVTGHPPLFPYEGKTMRTAVLAALFALCGVAWAQQEPPPNPPPAEAPPALEVKTVKVTAQGYNPDDAIKQALRKALEQGAAVQIASYSQTENYALARDTIYSRAAGIIRDYRISSETEVAGGMWEVTLEATVRPSAVAEAWGEVQNVLDQIGRPKIMVWIDEKIDGRPESSSIVETNIEEMFVKAGFDLVAREGVEDIRRREVHDAQDERNIAKLARLAKEAGAEILIRGSANADRAGIEDLYGTPAAFYNCDVQAKVYYTDNGRLLTTESIPVTRRGVRSRNEFSPQAARAALVAATFPRSETRREPALATKLFESVMEQWSTQISTGGDIDLEVEGIDFKTFVELKKALAGLERVRSAEGEFTKGTGKFRIKAQMSAQMLAELLTAKPFAGWLEVVDLKLNRIQAKAGQAHERPASSQPVESATSKP